MSVALLNIGTELTRGEINNTNATWLSEIVTDLGHRVATIEVLPDDKNTIVACLERLGRQHRFLICTGGLGPTTDDLTSECVAKALNVELKRDKASLERIRERMESFGRTMAPSNEKQADFPKGATVLPNDKGTAPGFAVDLFNARAFFLPGVPREMHALVHRFVEPELTGSATETLLQVRVKTFGMTESAVNDRLQGLAAKCDVSVAYRAHFPEIEVKLSAQRKSLPDAQRAAEAAAREVESRLGSDIVYGQGSITYPEAIGELLRSRGATLACGESCTGGMLGQLLTDKAKSSDFFLGSAVTYANSAKEGLLNIPKDLLQKHGAVSPEVARAMARETRRVFGADYGIGITGIAGPGGGSEGKPVGLVHFAVSSEKSFVDHRIRFPASRAQIRRLGCFAALSLLRRTLRREYPSSALSD